MQTICNKIIAPIIKYLRRFTDELCEPWHTFIRIEFEAILQNSLSTVKSVL